jgi:bifunctional DNase/RNase
MTTMLPMKVFGLAMDEDTQVPVLILKDEEEKTVLPIWIGAMEAMAISLALNGVELPRPMTHDLLLKAIDTLDSKVLAVQVVDLKDGTYYAEIEVAQGEKTKRIDCRPSDAIALALRAQAPISVSQEVIDMAHASPRPRTSPVIPGEQADKWADLLEDLSPDDLNYKM